ncbi:MAG: EAL domain-containing protein [Rhodospirillales bacterium]|jgi:EAL domain-containing protein (putative c-di-GMP-specific phosphodiesterase class I)|nr:EAL domain-containing protein [Rhodospirillales bacterium]MDP7215590.1 EAL domain-containing protein [Rhodospirillales bacterium]HIJ43305.1 EAL domain-containing protein [Rhodospirillaceae bacterium]HIJ46113.1 EAL domain-containing protein [Rhodospirillaceae bacterium]HIJ93191.1 EAL domain-containing protein [Rhodospirillaceae bacterium]
MADTGSAMATPGHETTNEDNLLLSHLRRLKGNLKGLFCVHVHLSGLRASNRKPHFINIAARCFDDLVNNRETTLFQLSNVDLILLCREVPIEEIDPVIDKVRALFNEDPLTFGEAGSLDDRFTTWRDLSQAADFTGFLSTIGKLVEEAAKRRRKKAKSRAGTAVNLLRGKPLEPGNLSVINHKLQGVRIADLIRQQTAVEVFSGAKGEVLFREHYVAIAGLQKRMSPDINLFSDTWLFQYLTETLDRRLLAVVARKNFAKLSESISINLNISTVLAGDFQHFHRSVGDNTRRVVIELQLIDIFADLQAFHYARETLQDQGYRALIDGMTPLTFQYFDPGQLMADYVKINWLAEFLGEMPDERIAEIRDVVENTGKEKVILARVDCEEAVKWALSLGVTRFQGHFIDTLVEAMISKGIL